MDERARAIIEEARETLHRVRDVRVEHREHRDDGLLTEHSVNMPKKPPPPTADEVSQMINDALTAHDELWRDVVGAVIAQERKGMRAEVQKLRDEHDLRISALLHATEKHGVADVIDLPALPLRGRRA